MKAVLLWELSRRRSYTLWWTIGISSLIGLTVMAYKAIGSETQQLDAAFGDLTDSAGSFFGGTDFFSPVGYLSSQIYYILLPLLLIILVTTLVSSLMVRDENDTTVELTLARPISRGHLLLAKALAGLIIVSVVGVLSYAVTVVTVLAADIDINQWHLLLTHVLSFLFSASFGILAYMLIAVSRATRRVAGIAAIILSFGGYVINSLAAFVDWLEQPAKLMPYHYYDTAALLSGHVSRGLLLYLTGVIVVASIVSAIGYNRRDIG